MTKTLNEQWREGTLREGWYYLKVKSELANYPVIAECVIDYSSLKPYSYFYEYDDSHVEEVLAPVPSYKEYNKLKKLPLKCFQLEEDNSALVVINKDMCKEIERLQKQLKEANDLIMWVVRTIPTGNKDEDDFDRYCNKWDVK